MPKQFKFLRDGQVVTVQEAKEASVRVVVDNEEAVRLFSSEHSFNAWAKKSEYAEKLQKIEELCIRSKQYENSDNTTSINRQKTIIKRINDDLENLSKETGLLINSEELFGRATMNYHPLDGAIFDPAILYEHENRKGRALPVSDGVAFADLRWHNFNDITTSVTVLGICELWQHIWYSGRRVVLIASLPRSFNLADIGFNDTVSCVAAH